jgi:hypothetical protein
LKASAYLETTCPTKGRPLRCARLTPPARPRADVDSDEEQEGVVVIAKPSEARLRGNRPSAGRAAAARSQQEGYAEKVGRLFKPSGDG